MTIAKALLTSSIVLILLLRADPLKGTPQSERSETGQVAQSSGQRIATAVESYIDRVRREGAFLELSLNEAPRLALVNNLEIAIEEFNEDLHRQRLVQTKGFFVSLQKATFTIISENDLLLANQKNKSEDPL